ncbi:MAG: type II toxin-antitoxin system prevent-host-death family antitoxin [Alteromonadaceae bacterium]|nr:type II toxin-antitoxin system prevent-host-death family antitoxin [Alteromonadaceae bacterium]
MNVETISFLKKNAANLPLEEPLTITQNGKPAYVIESIEERDKREEAIALLKLVSFAKNDMQKGRVMSSSSFKDRLAQRKQTLIQVNKNDTSSN